MVIKEKTCCFAGHRLIPEEDRDWVRRRLEQEIKGLIGKGVIFFVCGGALGFDTLAALTVLEQKKKHPHIKLMLMLPCKDQMMGWEEEDVAVYQSILRQADNVKYVWQAYFKGIMLVRNHLLVDSAAYCVAYLTRDTGGTAFTINYAKEKGVALIMI